MTQAVTLRPTQPLTTPEWAMLREQAGFLVKSGFLPSGIRSPEQAIAIMLLGREIGLEGKPWAALSTINVIQGKPTVSPQLMLALIERSGQAEQIDIQGDAAACTVTMQRRGRTAHTTTFTMEHAKALGLASKDNWVKQPAVMLQWRAVAACARVCFPDVILGLYLPEELGADVSFTDSGEMVLTPEPFTVQVGDMPDTSPIHLDDSGEIPFDDSDPPALDPHRVVAYNQLIRRALAANNAAGAAGKPEPFDLAEWEILAGTTLEQLNDKGRRLKAKLQELEAVSV